MAFTRRTLLAGFAAAVLGRVRLWARQSAPTAAVGSTPLQISGIYPHLAVYNDTGGEQDRECGIGAVVPWAGKLWLITYPPHRRTGSPDKLYEIDDQLRLTARPESVGGTHAGRMIHRESQQLVIGPYFIDASGGVRAVDQRKGFPARITAIARHLTDPEQLVYMADMEGPIWEVHVKTLETRRIFVKPVPGWHAKGAYTGQGRFIVANNGELRTPDLDALEWELPESTWSKGPEDAGALAEFDGKAWTVVARRPHTDVTGPGGLAGESSPDAPIWSIGWDKRSVLLQVRANGAWHTYRLPKGSYTYDPTHGWFTEWPRIREIGDGAFLLNMHGTYFDFPPAFTPGRTAGLRPLSTHLHYTTDFTEWKGQVVLAGDDTSILQNLLAARPQSNLRFVAHGQLATEFGPRSGWGGMWAKDPVTAGQPSLPFHIAGYADRYLHLAHDQRSPVTFTLEIDAVGDGTWQPWRTISVSEEGYLSLLVPRDLTAEWMRVSSDRDVTATAFFHLQTPRSAGVSESMNFASLAPAEAAAPWNGGLLRPAGFSRVLQYLARGRGGTSERETYYEIDERLQFSPVVSPERIGDLKKAAEPAVDYTVDAASVLVVDSAGRRWRLPKSRHPIEPAGARGIREVISERYLANIHGTFYEIPRLESKTVPDFRRMKPIASHGFSISDFATWRGLLVLAGTRADATPDGHFFRAAGPDGAGLWFGAVDDLYHLGAPAGDGGPWRETIVEAGEPSDPYLMTNFGAKTLMLSHVLERTVRVTIEVDVLADGSWVRYAALDVPAGQPLVHAFPEGFGAHWVRLTADAAGPMTAQFTYS